MNKKKILIVSRSFYPKNSPRSFRATELAKEFAKQGHEVTALIHMDDSFDNNFSKEYDIQVEDFVHKNYKQIRSKNKIVRGIRFLLKYFFIFPEIQYILLLYNSLKNKSGYDLLISVAQPYPVHWGVALAKKKNKNLCKIWIADCGDPFLGNQEKKLGFPFYFKFIENWFCKKPDYITIPIDKAIKAYPSFCHEKIKVIPQGFNFDEFKNLSQNSKNPYPYFAYAGILGINVRNPQKFLDYLCTKTEQNFKFIIYTKELEIVNSYKNLLGEKLEINNYIPRVHLLQELSKMDFLVNFENKNKVQSPSKLIDYTLLKKPILSIEHNKLNPKIVDEFLSGNYKNQLQLNNIQQYEIRNVTKQFLFLSENRESMLAL